MTSKRLSKSWVENIPRKKSDWYASSSFRKWVIDFFIIHIERVEISTLFYYAKNKTIKRVKKIFYFSILAKKMRIFACNKFL